MIRSLSRPLALSKMFVAVEIYVAVAPHGQQRLILHLVRVVVERTQIGLAYGTEALFACAAVLLHSSLVMLEHTLLYGLVKFLYGIERHIP